MYLYGSVLYVSYPGDGNELLNDLGPLFQILKLKNAVHYPVAHLNSHVINNKGHMTDTHTP